MSRTTISHTLNGLGKVDLRTRERVQRIAAELGYRPDPRAQRLRKGQAWAIALASSIPLAVAGGPSRLDFSMEVAAAVAERARVHGFALVAAPPVKSGAGLSSVDIDGAIVAEPDVDDAAVTRLREPGLLFVTWAARCRRRPRHAASIWAASHSDCPAALPVPTCSSSSAAT